MKSVIKFETNISQHNINFLDVKVKLEQGKIMTSLHTKPTDAHLYLSWSSCHPNHILKNIPKGQFIRIRRICSEYKDFIKHSNELIYHLIERGYPNKIITKAFNEVKNIERTSLLLDTSKSQRDEKVIFTCTWHPKFSELPSILKKNYHIIENDIKLSKIFQSKPTVAFRRKKSLANFLTKTDIKHDKKLKKPTSPCGKCKICPLINQNNTTENGNIKVKVENGEDCRSTGVIYIARCKKHSQCYIGKTSVSLAKRFSKHKYDISKRPRNNELAEHFHENHSIDQDRYSIRKKHKKDTKKQIKKERKKKTNK